MVTRVVDARAPLIQNGEAALEKLNAATAQLEKLNPENGRLIKELRERVSRDGVTEDVLSEIVSFVLAAEKAGSIPDTAREAQSVRERARKIREETLKLQQNMAEMRGCVQDLQRVLDSKTANTEFIRDLAKKS